MKKIIIAIMILQNAMHLLAQEKTFEFNKPVDWPEISQAQVSPTGKYVSYIVRSKRNSQLNIVSTDGTWNKEIPGGSGAKFTDDAQFIICKTADDSLSVFSLYNHSYSSYRGTDFKIVTVADHDYFALFHKPTQKLMLLNLKQKTHVEYNGVRDYLFSPQKDFLLIQKYMDKSMTDYEIDKVGLMTGQAKCIYKGKIPGSNFCIDQSENRIAFLLTFGVTNDIYLYHTGMDNAALYLAHNTPALNGGNISNSAMHFSKDGKDLFFSVGEVNTGPTNEEEPCKNLVIWNYKDEYIRSMQAPLVQEATGIVYPWVINESDGKPIRLAYKSDVQLNRGLSADDTQLLLYNKVYNSEYYWDNERLADLCLVSIKTGKREIIAKKQIHDYQASFSPDGKYAIWYDRIKNHYFSYNTITKAIVNVTDHLPFSVADELHDHDPALPPTAYGIAGWGADGICYIYDRYDIWAVSMNGQTAPQSITQGLGRTNKIVLRFVYPNIAYNELKPKLTINSHTLYAGFDETTKDNGFIEISNRHLNKTAWGAHVCYFPFGLMNYSRSALNGFLQKAANSNTYLFEIESPADFPNLYVLNDGKVLRQISFLQPQKDYKWLTTELLRYPLNNGGTGEAILYKPQHLDPQKKYPVIFHFYDKYSYSLNKFIRPELSEADINIPWFVNHGYIVCVPDIYYKIGKTGECVFNSVLSAVSDLAKYSYIDTTKMGVQGHSFSGYEVDELLTRTNIFKCAVAGAGVSDCLSLYGGILPRGLPNAPDETIGLLRLGMATPWERPDIFLENSPVMHADQVHTPVLIMHNELDGNVPFYQGVEWFTDLRRLKKKAWLLQYTGQHHGLSDPENQLDYSIRLMQFFDHYLMGQPAPKWMSAAIGNNLFKPTYAGYKLDVTGSEP